MIDAWFMLIPMFIIWVQHRAVGRISDYAKSLQADMENQLDVNRDLIEDNRKLIVKIKTVNDELSAIYRDIADSTKVSDVHNFLRMRVERRKSERAKMNEKDSG